MDPVKQAFPFTCPDCFGAELVEQLGPFHTLGMPEQVHPLSHQRYGYEPFLAECKAVSGERRKMLALELDRFERGVLAFVIDTSDRIQHALWATQDPGHPAYDAALASRFAQVIPAMYREMDDVLGDVLAKIDSQTALIVLSDHGFNSFRRAVHVNRWLIENGYMRLKGGADQEGRELFQDVDWARTRAYALGFASIYLNTKGREGEGCVEREVEVPRLLEELAAKLRGWKDAGMYGSKGASEGGMQKKILVIGLDSAEPTLVFERWWDELPNLRRLAEAGCHMRLKSCDPPITVPAWSVMTSGLDPGRLGCYGFRNRKDHSYGELVVADGSSMREKRIWDYLSAAGRKVIVLGVPQTYPPYPVDGCMVSCFLTPGTHAEYTYPAALKAEVEAVSGGYLLDVTGFRDAEKQELLQRIYRMTEKRFRVARHLLATKPWDFFMLVEIGLDRLQHVFWSFQDPSHPDFQPNHPLQSAIHDYYVFLDRLVGELVDEFGRDAHVLVVSDHGAQRMEGGFCLNEWLLQAGYLALKEPQKKGAGLGIPGTSPSQGGEKKRPVPLQPEMVDWPRTQAWGEGGYYGRIFLNVKGREPQGAVEPAEYEQVRGRLIVDLQNLKDAQGGPLPTQVFRPQDLYSECRGIPPDLLAYFGHLKWRALGSIGHGSLYSSTNDTGADAANHAPYGIFIANWPWQGHGNAERARILEQLRQLGYL